MNFEKGVLFDPGYSQYVPNFAFNADYIGQTLRGIKNLNQKKFQYRLMSAKLMEMFDNVVAFYLGCLLWASYIKYAHAGCDVLENHTFGQTMTEDEYLFDVNYMIDYVDIFQKDFKYYLNKEFQIGENTLNILNLYKDFLKINQGLSNVKCTDDIKLPPELLVPSGKELEDILETIEKVIECGNLRMLFSLYEKII